MSYPSTPSISAERTEARWEAFRAKLTKLPMRWVVLFSVVGLVVLAFLMRCLHLFDSNHYYILSPDSYFFHWLSNRVMAGQGPPPDAPAGALSTLHTGLSYPLAYIAKAAEHVFGVSPPNALHSVSMFLSPILAVISMVLIYLFAARICDRRVAFFSAFAWALMLWPIALGSSGFLDRDGLSMLLLTTGAFQFYLSDIWHFKIGGRDMGWLIASIGVLVTEALLYVEWGVAGPALLLAVIAAYCVGRFLVEYLEHTETEPGTVRRLGAAMSKVNWRSFGLIIGATALVAGANFHLASSGFEQLISIVKPSGGSISEEEGLGLPDLTSYQFFLIPMVLGFYVAWKRRAQSSIFFSSWFLILFVLAIVAKRVLLYASPAACLLSGVGLAFLWDWARRRSLHTWARRGPLHMWKKVALAVLLCVTVALAFSSAYSLASTAVMAPDREWQGALAYLREETPKDSVVMSQWTWGYWILDLGQRKPLIDNGYYGYDPGRLRDVGLAYSTADPAEAAQAMKKWGADYLVFSKLDLNVATTIIAWANVGKGLSNFPDNSLVMRCIRGEFESGGGLEVVYRSPPEPNSKSPSEPEVVILGLTQ